MKKIYQKPTMHNIVLQHRNNLLLEGSPAERPRATFMSNPTIGDDDGD